MSEESPRRRAVQGAIEGAGIGALAALVRAVGKTIRKGLPADLSSHIPEIAGYFIIYIVGMSYVFATGRAIANGLSGALLGTLLLAVGGTFAATAIPYEATGFPFPLLAGGIAGGMIGAPLGAFIQRRLARKTESR